MKKTLYLDEEEKELEEALNRGEWRSVKNVKEEIGKHQQYARNTLLKDKRLNIRISSADLETLQTKAVEERLHIKPSSPAFCTNSRPDDPW